MDDLVKRLREPYEQRQSRRVADEFQAADRIEALERQVKAADALADILTEAMHEHDTANYEYGEENPWTMQEWFSDEDRAALAAYRATKEGGE